MRYVLAAAAIAVAVPVSAEAAVIVRTANVQLPDDPIGLDYNGDGHFGGIFALDQALDGLQAGDTVELNIILSRSLVFAAGVPPRWLDDQGFTPAGFSLGSTSPEIASSITFEVGGATGDIVSSGAFDFVERSSDKTPFLQLVADPATFGGGSYSSLKLTYTIANANARPITSTYFGSSSEAPAAAIPEPATWAMMLAGFGLAGAAARRRSPAGRIRRAEQRTR